MRTESYQNIKNLVTRYMLEQNSSKVVLLP